MIEYMNIILDNPDKVQVVKSLTWLLPSAGPCWRPPPASWWGIRRGKHKSRRR